MTSCAEEARQEAVRREGPELGEGRLGMGLGSSGTVMFRRLHIEVGSEGRLSSRENMGRRGGQKVFKSSNEQSTLDGDRAVDG